MALNHGYSYLTHDGDAGTFEYIVGGELPAIKLWWVDDQDTLINFATGWTFTATISRGGTDYVTKTTGITGAAGSGNPTSGAPNLTVTWADSEFSTILNAGLYVLKIEANQASTSADAFLTFQFHYSSPGTITWTYSGDPSASSREAVRYMIGDTNYSDQLLSDQEIDYQLTQSGSIAIAASDCCLAIAARFARCIDKSVGSLSRTFSQKHQHYLQLSADLSKKGSASPVAPWASGWSRSGKEAVDDNTDRERTFARKGIHDNNRTDYGEKEFGSRYGWDD